jgi:hypothetical protein
MFIRVVTNVAAIDVSLVCGQLSIKIDFNLELSMLSKKDPKYGTYIKTIRIIMSDVLTDFKGLERILAILSQKCRPEKILLKFSSNWSYACRYVLKGDSPPIDHIMLLIGSFFESIDSSRLKSILIDICSIFRYNAVVLFWTIGNRLLEVGIIATASC